MAEPTLQRPAVHAEARPLEPAEKPQMQATEASALDGHAEEPADAAQNDAQEDQNPRFQGTIRTLLFIGDQYEAVIGLATGEELHFYLPKSFQWHQGQNIIMRFNRGVSVWPE